MSGAMADALRLVGVTRQFGPLKANDDINLSIRQSEVHAILGENGAGKSTLMRIVAGVIAPDSGEIFVGGVRVAIRSPHDAAQFGIQMVHQHFALIGSLTVAENLHLACQKNLSGRVALAEVRSELAQLSADYGISLDPDALVDNLTIGNQQRLEIARALLLQARILILDEPTAVLTPNEVEDLFRLLRKLKSDRVSIIFISHKLSEVMAIADRVTVLRHGRVVDSLDTANATVERLSLAVVGRPINLNKRRDATRQVAVAEPVLRVEGVSTPQSRERVGLQNINLTVHAGEIVGIAGVDGNGQAELVDVIVGIARPETGTLHMRTGDLDANAASLGFAHIPDDRGRKGLVLGMTCLDNILLRHRLDPALARFGFIRRGRARQRIGELLKRFAVRESAIDVAAGALSGGNQQRILLARELAGAPRVIIAAQPTRGVDVAGAAFVHETLRACRESGAGILIVSTELEEILALCDRVVVMFRGRIMGEMPGENADPFQLGAMMMGREERAAAQ